VSRAQLEVEDLRVKRTFLQRTIYATCALSFLVTACSAPGSRSVVPAAGGTLMQTEQAVPGLTLSKYVKHVVIIVQENRSFENLFAGFHGANAPMYGYEKVKQGSNYVVKKINLQKIDWQAPTIYHGVEWTFKAYDNGKMDQFNLVPFDKPPNNPSGTASYAYLDPNLIKPYRQMAYDYTLADNMYPTAWGGSFSAHLDLIAGTTQISSSQAVTVPNNVPWGCKSPYGPPAGTKTQTLNPQHHWSGYPPSNPAPWGPFPCFTQFSTMAGTLDHAKISWKYYAPSITEDQGGKVWSEFRAIDAVFNGPDWKTHVISPETTVLTDISKGKLPQVSWVIPKAHNSDHDVGDTGGPSWVTSIVNAIGLSNYWNDTAVFVLWDDWGGWYDNAPPPQPDFVGLGFRVPCIVISPYSRVHHISHTQYEFGSLLKFIEAAFGLPSLHHTDERANSITDSFDFTAPPHKFQKIDAPINAEYFLHQPADTVPPDDE
jgi:phospholipase C